MSDYDITYMFTMSGLKAGRIRLELRELSDCIAADNWSSAVPMMDAIEEWSKR